MTRLLACIALAAALSPGASISPSGAVTLYVDDDAPPGGDGLGWATAHRFLQDALSHADADGDVVEIRVAQGVYRPDRDEANPDPGYSDDPCCVPNTGCQDQACLDAVCAELPFCCDSPWYQDCAEAAFQLCELACPDRHARFELVGGVTLLGGFAGLGASNPDTRDIGVFQSVLSGDLFGNDRPDWQGRGDNSYQIVLAQQPGLCRLDGFTITGNNNLWNWSPQGYGAIAVIDGTLIVASCMLTSNQGHLGGAITNESNLVVEHSTFYANEGFYGGAICSFGAMSVSSSTFKGNYGYTGGAILGWVAGACDIDNSLFSLNHGTYGGGITNVGSAFRVTGSTFSGHQWGHVPGGSAVVNFVSQDAPTVTTLHNCIFFANEAPAVGTEIPLTTPVASHCLIEGGYKGIGNIDADPLFVRNPGRGPDGIWFTRDDDFGDLHLLPGSPAIDAGDVTAMALKTADLDGNPRLVDDPDTPDTGSPAGHRPIVDLGAYEFRPGE